MTKGSPNYKKRPLAIKRARVVCSSTKGDLAAILGVKVRNVAEKNLAAKFANDIKGVKGVKPDDHRAG